MSIADQPAERVILHVADDERLLCRQMQDALLTTGRTIIRRGDLFRAMGAVVASRRGRRLEAVIVATGVIDHEDAEFFQMLSGWRWAPPVYLYGEDDAGAVDPKIRQAVNAQVTLDAIPTLFSTAPGNPPEQASDSEPTDSLEAGEDPPDAGLTPEPGSVPAGMPIEELPPINLSEPTAPAAETAQTEQPTDETAADELDRLEDVALDAAGPPVPWRPRQNAPTRIPPADPPGQPNAPSSPNEPLLSREELEALLNQDHDPDAAEHTA